MHELPKELNNSLRSYRGSVYGRNSLRKSPSDLEKGPDDYGEKVGALSPAQSSVILHPSASSRSLRQLLRLQKPQDTHFQPEHGALLAQHQQPQQGGQGGEGGDQPQQASPKAITKRQATFQNPPQTPASQKLSLFHNAPKIDDPDPASDRLDDDKTPLSKEQFYELIGMYPPQTRPKDAPQNQPPPLPKDLAVPHGLYGKVRSHMKYVQIKYRVFDVATYVFLALQLLLSAVFIVLGSVRSDYHVALAVLGAVSAVIAGALALMKGQGLPNRLRQIRDDLINVIFEIEELYWDVIADRPILFKDIVKVREDYLRVLQEARKNHPDSWTGNADAVAKGITASSTTTTTTTTKGKSVAK